MHSGQHEGQTPIGGGSRGGEVAAAVAAPTGSSQATAGRGDGIGVGIGLIGARGDAVRTAMGAVVDLLEMLESEPAPPGEVLELAEQLGALVTRVNAAHTLAVGQAKDSGMWALLGFASSTAWLRFTHLMDASRARALELTATWLDGNPLTRAAFIAGRITAEHVAAIRRVTASCPRRARAYPVFEEALLQVAGNCDPQRTARLIRAWADALDSTSGNEEAQNDYDRRSLHLSPVGDGWDLRGWLPSAIGAEVAGLLNEAMEQRRRESDDDALDAPSARRLDAFMDLVRAAAASGRTDGFGPFLTNGARHRARVVVTIPLQRLIATRSDDPCDPIQEDGFRSAVRFPENDHVAGALGEPLFGNGLGDPASCAGSWECHNGPGEGFLCSNDFLRLSCDAEIQRLVLGPQSQPLDIGRSTRVVPDHIRTALHRRDGGCVMPGCRRPPGWCEAHHIEHWSAGGSTSVGNLALICARHHHELHNNSWRITMIQGIPHVERRVRDRPPGAVETPAAGGPPAAGGT